MFICDEIINKLEELSLTTQDYKELYDFVKKEVD